jgi:hypothetical protein
MNMATQTAPGTKPGLTRTATVDKNGRRTHTFKKPQGAAFDGLLTNDSADGARQASLASAGPSTITRGASIGYSVSESRMSREFVAVEDRHLVAARLAAETEAELVADGRENAGDYKASQTEYWMTQFDAYDIFEEEAPSDYTEAQRQGFNSVSLKSLNLDLDHQSFHTNLRTVTSNETLARNVDGPYRRGSTPAHQARNDEAWNARADRLTSVREQLEVLQAR